MTSIRIYYTAALLDAVLTVIGLGMGLREANPLYGLLGLGGVLTLKAVVTAIVVAIVAWLLSRPGNTPALALTTFRLVLVLQVLAVAGNAIQIAARP